MPSKTAFPVIWCSATPAIATTLPVTAAESSKRTVFVVGSREARRCTCSESPRPCASPLVCRYARTREIPSATTATASTA